MTDAGSTAGLTVTHDAAELVVDPDEGADVVVLEDTVFAALDGEAVAVDPTIKVLTDYPVENAETAIDATGKTVLPDFVDPHTYVSSTGDRSDKSMTKLQGATYGGILADGGGILRIVDAIRRVSNDKLAVTLTDHLGAIFAHGTTTVEIKTGYDLDTGTELRMFSVIDAAGSDHPIDVIPTFMGVHAVPRDADVEEYTKSAVFDQLPAVAAQGIAKFCDVSRERGMLTAERSCRILSAGRDHDLTPKIHTDEFATIGGIDVAALVGAASADHLLHIDNEGRDTLVNAGVTPALLSGTVFGLGAGYTDARAFLDAGHEIVLTIDFNPDCSAWGMSFVATLVSVGMRMTPHEAIRGTTNATTSALDHDDGMGTLHAGTPANVIVLDVSATSYLSYRFDTNPVSTVLKSGVIARE